ncbi:C-type mannose receptor 2-like [Cottoperca gobio]|uniref:C-type mannose receptor 2-like n=1 Tax=Cottoperca gobio TaxID=56716 RepID=A0A6J2QSY4_COTGO|nr:C-type mannose receptor 2-like [Cottoperca gobio]
MLLQLLSFAALLACAHCQCQPGWREYENKCYLFSADKKSWTEANAFCSSQSGNLMSILDIHERLWMRTQIGTEIYWIGLNDHVSEGVYEWSDGSPFIPYLSYWKTGQPDNWGDEPGEDCGQVLGANDGQWNDENCNAKRKYICKHVNPNPGPQCDLANGWRQYGSNCYKLNANTRKSWMAARHDCVQEGGDLVSITSAEEELYVTGTLDPSWIDLWIGLSTLVRGT